MKKVCNVFGILLAFLLSVVLVFVMILAPLWQGMAGLLEPTFLESAVAEIVEEIDLSEISLSDPELLQEMEEAGFTREAAEAILSSRTLQQLIEAIGHDFVLVLTGSFESFSIKEADLAQIAAENRAELVQILRLMEPEATAAVSDEMLGQMVEQAVITEGAALIAELNGAMLELQTTLQNEYATVLALLQGPMVLYALLITIAVFALLIFLCRWPHQKGLLWLGIDAALAAIPVLGIAAIFKSAQLSQAISAGAGVPDVFAPVLRHVGNTVLTGGLILMTAAVVLIALFVLLRSRRLKRQTACADTAPVQDRPAEAPPADSPLNDVAPARRSPWDDM